MEPMIRQPQAGGAARMPRKLSSKGRQTQQAIEEAARKLFAENGFHGTTVADITSAAGKSPAVFYRYFNDKADLVSALARTFIHDVLLPSGVHVHLPETPQDTEFFATAVTAFWGMFKEHIGTVVAVAQLTAIQPRFTLLQNEVRRFGMGVVAASVRRAHEHGYARELDPDNTALAINLLFEQFTIACLLPDTGVQDRQLSDTDAIATLSTIWKKTLYGDI